MPLSLALEGPALDSRRRSRRSAVPGRAYLRRHVALEHVAGLDHVVVDADQDHVFDVHNGSP